MAVGNILEELFGSPLGPQDLTLGVAGRADAAELAGESDEEIVATLRTAGTGKAVGEDAAVQVAVDSLLGALAQRPVGRGEALVLHLHEALEVLGQHAVQHRAVGTPGR